ncbi:hypothetical protein C1O66_04925 [Paucibacter aquatile]|uniref:Uncharacterized protein n=1 Tax=Kinneretia aquatilis TaxID=2070761 RepID=A0A2N8KU15_9BURK|nr:hypothetical protein [Paucibacter aquatile]PND36944.1 hypothetical protein C1O66_04925 [Paucibacter aquatile]
MIDFMFWPSALVFVMLLRVDSKVRTFMVVVTLFFWMSSIAWSGYQFLNWQLKAIELIMLGAVASKAKALGFRIGYLILVAAALLGLRGASPSVALVLCSCALASCFFGWHIEIVEKRKMLSPRWWIGFESFVDRLHPYDFIMLMAIPFFQISRGVDILR